MKVYSLHAPLSRQISMGFGPMIAIFVVNNDNPPPDIVITKLAARNYALVERGSIQFPNSAESWDDLVRAEVRADQDLDPDFPYWPEP